jgi:hypothetical protein
MKEKQKFYVLIDDDHVIINISKNKDLISSLVKEEEGKRLQEWNIEEEDYYYQPVYSETYTDNNLEEEYIYGGKICSTKKEAIEDYHRLYTSYYENEDNSCGFINFISKETDGDELYKVLYSEFV